MKRTERHPLQPGDVIKSRELSTFDDRRLRIPDRDHIVHLQFRRFAGCPVCKLHLRSIGARIAELEAAGIREVAVFHSSVEAMHRHDIQLPFAVVADPDEELYHEFGVRKSLRSVLDPRAWSAIAKGLAQFGPGKEPDESALGLPADFLIAPNGQVIACKYGKHADDHLSVDELIALASPVTAAGVAA